MINHGTIQNNNASALLFGLKTNQIGFTFCTNQFLKLCRPRFLFLIIPLQLTVL